MYTEMSIILYPISDVLGKISFIASVTISDFNFYFPMKFNGTEELHLWEFTYLCQYANAKNTKWCISAYIQSYISFRNLFFSRKCYCLPLLDKIIMLCAQDLCGIDNHVLCPT